METTFIYALCEPHSRTVRYIGKSSDPKVRFKQHLRRAVRAKTHLGNWLRSLLSLGEKPTLVVLREAPAETWQEAEERYIRLAKGLGMKLVNGTDGGEGASLLGPNNPSFGKCGERSPTYGRIHTLEDRAKMSVFHKGRRALHKEKPHSASRKSAISVSVKAFWARRKAAQV